MIRIKPTQKPRFIKLQYDDWRPIIQNKIECPTCGLDEIKKSTSKWIGKCKTCGHVHNFLYPTPIQLLLIHLRAKIMNMFGGTGSGKTTASAAIISETIRMKPGVKVVAFAQTDDQLKSTAKAELEKFFYKNEFKIWNDKMWVHKNGSIIQWYTSDSEQKIRGMNVGLAWLVESSGIKYEIFKQLMTRTRQDEMKIFLKSDDGTPLMQYDEKEKRYEAIVLEEHGMLINETNPTYEWPREKALFKSHTIMYTESVRGVDKIKSFCEPMKDPENTSEVLDMVSIMFASPDNPMMTREYLSSIRMTYDDKEEYDRDIYCDMSYSKGLIYGEYVDEMFVPVTETWAAGNITYSEALDPGGAAKGNDESAYGIFRVTPSKSGRELPLLELIDGYKISGLSTAEEAIEIWKKRRKYNWSREKSGFFAVDPHGVKNEKRTKSNMIKDLQGYDIYMSKEGVNDDPDYGIKRVKDFLKAGKLKIFDNEFGKQVLDELSSYIWTNKTTTNRGGRKVQKPIDRNNHIMDMIRFFVTKVPVTPEALAIINEDRDLIGTNKADTNNPYNWKQVDEEEDDKTNDLNKGGGVFIDIF